MSRRDFRVALAGLIVGALLVTAIPAFGAAGDELIVGGRNHSGARVTRLKGKGNPTLRLINPVDNPALELRVTAGTPPMAVNSNALVANLNADLVDGKGAASFLPVGGKAADSNLLDGLDSTDFLGATAQAADSDKVDGFDANGLVRVAHAETSNVDDPAVFGSNTYGDILSTQITAPTPGLLFIVGGTNSAAPNPGAEGDLYGCSIHVNNNAVVGSERFVRPAYIDGAHTYNNEEDCSTNAVEEVTAGTHTVDLYVADRSTSSPQVEFSSASLQVLFVPFGADGTQPSP